MNYKIQGNGVSCLLTNSWAPVPAAENEERKQAHLGQGMQIRKGCNERQRCGADGYRAGI